MKDKNHKKLKKYIKKSRKLGFSIKEITDSLLRAGWDEDQIKKAFEDVSTKSFLRIFHIFKRN